MSYQVIARKYRPQIFDEVAGQSLITETLKNAVLNKRVAHGYIFSGGRGVGKTTTARILAKSLNCIHGPTVSPCGECPSCREIAQGNSVDVFEIDAASNRGIDEIRELRENVRYLPARDPYKVFIIDEAHMLTTEAFNALLKTLEEPPPRSLFVLCTTEAHKLPTTIQSRCQHFSFRLLDHAEIRERLDWVLKQEQLQADDGALSAVAEAAEGSLRDALSLLDQAIASSRDRLEEAHVRQLLGVVPSRVLVELVEAIDEGNAARVLETVGKLSAEGYELNHFCGEFTRYIRNLAVAKSCGSKSPLLQLAEGDRARLAELAERFSEEDLARFFQILIHAESEMRYALNPRFHLELALLKMTHVRKLKPLERVIAQLRGNRTAAAPKQGPPSRPAGRTASPPAFQEKKTPPPQTARPTAARATGNPPQPTPARATSRPPRPAPVSPRAEQEPEQPSQQPSGPAVASDPRLDKIRSLAFGQSKLLSSCLDPVTGWRFENGEVHFVFPKDHAWAVGFLGGREQQDKLRSVCEEALGQPVKICVTLEDQEEIGLKKVRSSARERAESDQGVEAIVKAFQCTLVDVVDLSRE